MSLAYVTPTDLQSLSLARGSMVFAVQASPGATMNVLGEMRAAKRLGRGEGGGQRSVCSLRPDRGPCGPCDARLDGTIVYTHPPPFNSPTPSGAQIPTAVALPTRGLRWRCGMTAPTAP